MSNPSEQAMDGVVEERLALTATLNQLAEINRYNHWIYEQFATALGHRVLEVGSGTGNITQFLLQQQREVVATDVLPKYRQELQTRFAGEARLQIRSFDLDHAAPAAFRTHQFDSVVCLNVLEHIEDDGFALQQMREVLTPGGKLALLVPAHQFLYGAFDEAVGHFRRYSKAALRTLLQQAGFTVQSLKFFNAAATLPWFINGRLLRRAYLPNEQVTLADKLVPLLKLERWLGPPLGISLIAIAQK
ncbi:MAG: class I SAM-dependent methyltransferase [Blastocatellia bacterium]